MARVISISNHKGGVGKTTSVVNIGAGLARQDRNVLMIDLDPQANLTICYGCAESENNIYNAIVKGIDLQPINVREHLDIIPASSTDMALAEAEINTETEAMDKIAVITDKFRQKYDYILIDCPPSLGLLTLNAFAASDEIIIPIQPHFLAVKGLAKIIEVVNKVKININPKLEISGVFITMFDKRKVLHKDVLDTVEMYFQDRVFQAKVRENIALAEAPAAGKDIYEYDMGSNGAFDYLRVVLEIIDMEKKYKS
ncbi:MAG: chromosome partitioning protein ParA [Bacteroidia bacterium]|nr:MAG: chromosome partitioning protein ParA [Bacteroidia bacterium]